MTARLSRLLRRRAAEDARVRAFVAAIRASADCCEACTPAPRVAIPVPTVELIATPRGPVWTLDAASRTRLHTDTAELPRIVATASAPLGGSRA